MEMVYVNYQPVTDQNTIRILNIRTSKHQIDIFLNKYINVFYEITGVKIIGNRRISYKPHLRMAYVYVSNSEMFHIFLGNNPDGSRHVKRMLNPLYQPNIDTDESIIKNIYLDTPEYIDVPYENPVPLCEIKTANEFVVPKIEPATLRNKKD